MSLPGVLRGTSRKCIDSDNARGMNRWDAHLHGCTTDSSARVLNFDDVTLNSCHIPTFQAYVYST